MHMTWIYSSFGLDYLILQNQGLFYQYLSCFHFIQKGQYRFLALNQVALKSKLQLWCTIFIPTGQESFTFLLFFGFYMWSFFWPLSLLICTLRNYFEVVRKVILQTRIFFQVGKKWFCKIRFFSGWRKGVLQIQIFFWLETQKTSGFKCKPIFFQVGEKWF